MLYAFWRMRSAYDGQQRYINARAYKKLREEYALNVGSMTCITQAGKKNSQWGKHWFTNLRTGESFPFKEKPDEFWIEGRNWFNKKRNTICKIHFKKEKHVKMKYEDYLVYKRQNTKNKYFKLLSKIWDGYHNSNESCLKNYIINVEKLNYNVMSNKFKKYFPIYKRLLKENSTVRLRIKPNKNLIGIYY